jgi:hypothetical protein
MSVSPLTEAVDFVKDHPEMFFPRGIPSPLICAQHLAAEVLALGGSDVLIERTRDWWIVSSSFDWFSANLSEKDQFRRLVPLPEVGENASRVEVVLTAFADAVATKHGEAAWSCISGPGIPPADVTVKEKVGRVVAFRFAVR